MLTIHAAVKSMHQARIITGSFGSLATNLSTSLLLQRLGKKEREAGMETRGRRIKEKGPLKRRERH
jgi:hypothetical protein